MFEQDRVIVRLQQRVLREKEIVLCFLAGSFGRGTEDSFSDLDVVLVFAEQTSRDEAFERRREFIQSVLPYVPAKSFDANHVMPYFHIALYSNGAKVDYHFEILSNLEITFSDPNIRLLKDTVGWEQRLRSLANITPPPRQTPTLNVSMITQLDNRFWVMYMDIYRLLLRGDVDKPYPIYLELLHFTMPNMLPFLPITDSARKGLISAYFSLEATITLNHLRALLPAYLDARSALISRHNIIFQPDVDFEREILKIIQKT